MRLHWDPPVKRHRNGEIVLYELLYHDRLHPADDWTTNTSDTSIVVDGLQPTTDYVFHIRAYTSQGAGPWSSQLLFRTTSVLRECRPVPYLGVWWGSNSHDSTYENFRMLFDIYLFAKNTA